MVKWHCDICKAVQRLHSQLTSSSMYYVRVPGRAWQASEWQRSSSTGVRNKPALGVQLSGADSAS
jgi:hypothetical protein